MFNAFSPLTRRRPSDPKRTPLGSVLRRNASHQSSRAPHSPRASIDSLPPGALAAGTSSLSHSQSGASKLAQNLKS